MPAHFDAEVVRAEDRVERHALLGALSRRFARYGEVGPAALLHPNQRGEENYARIIAAHLG
jgi:hypothetical protein